MKKFIIPIALTAILIFGFGCRAFSQSETDARDINGYDLPPYSAEKYVTDGDASVSDIAERFARGESVLSFESVITKIKDLLMDKLKENFSFAFQIIFVCMMFYFVGSLSFYKEHEKIFFPVCYGIVCTLITAEYYKAYCICDAATGAGIAFVDALVPTMAAMIASGGGVMASGAVCTVVFSALAVVGNVLKWLILPMINISFILSCAASVPSSPIPDIAALIKKIIKWICGLIFTVFTGILAISGYTASNLDQVAKKTAKFVFGNGVPFVGGFLSDSVETLAAATGVIKGAVGGAGICALASICLVPIVNLAAVCALSHITAAVSAPFSGKNVSVVITSLAESISLLLGICISVFMLLIICISLVMSFGIRS